MEEVFRQAPYVVQSTLVLYPYVPSFLDQLSSTLASQRGGQGDSGSMWRHTSGHTKWLAKLLGRVEKKKENSGSSSCFHNVFTIILENNYSSDSL